MHIDPRLSEIDDALYRVAVRAVIMQDDKVLLVKEVDGGGWWAVPGGGIDYGENIETCIARELEEELGISANMLVCDYKIAYYNIGKVVDGVPRMNIFFRVSIPAELIKKTTHIEDWGWFTKNQFIELKMNPSYKTELIDVIFK